MDDEELNEEQEPLDEPQKPSNPLSKVKDAGKTVVSTTINFTRDAVKFFLNPAIPLPVKIVLIVVAFVIILVVVVLDAEADETASAVNDTINSYMYVDNADEEGVKYFKEKASLIKFPLKDINAMYDKFINDDQYTSSQKESYRYILGTKEIKDGDNPNAITSDSTSMDMLNLVQKAVAMAQKGGIKYGSDGRQVASTIDELDSLTKTDCSGLVYSLFKTYLNIDVGAGSDGMKSKAESKHSENGWTAEFHKIGDGELKPGDILYRDGHVGLYVGTYGEKNHVDHGGPGDGPNNKNYENKSTKYTHYIRYTNPNATSGGGTADPNGNPAEGYQSAFTDSKNRTYKIYKQYENPWATHSYWKGKMQKYGCGPTTLAIIASGYGKNKTPANVADYMNSKHGYTGQGPLSETLSSFLGIKNTIYNSNFEAKIKETLNAGRPVVVSVNSTPDTRFTKASHIISFLGIRNNSEVFIGNVGANDSYTKKCGWNSLSGVIPYIGYIITIDSDS